MATFDERIGGVISSFYDAAFDPELWPLVLREITRLVQGNGACLFFVDRTLSPAGRFFSWQLSAEALDLYQQYYHARDVRLQCGVPKFVDRVCTDRDLVDDHAIKSSEFYQDFLNRFDQPYVVSGLVGLDDWVGICSCFRSADQSHAQGAEVAVMEALLPHLRRAMRLQRHLLRLDFERRAALEALQALGQAVLLVRRGCGIVWSSARAEDLLNERDGIVARRGRLACATSKDDAMLSRLIGTAAGARPDVAALPGGTLAIARPSMKRPYQVFVAPLPATAALAELIPAPTEPMAMVFITDPEHQTAPSASMLAPLHGFTPAEAKLAEAVAAGTSLKDYAEAAERSLHYVRWLLKQVEAKTDTRSQADLVRLLVGRVAPPATGG